MRLFSFMSLIISMLLSSSSSAQTSRLLRTAQHISCADYNDAAICDCTTGWMQDYMDYFIDPDVCPQRDSAIQSFLVHLDVDQRGYGTDTKVRPRSDIYDGVECVEHLAEIIEQLDGEREFLPSENEDGALAKRKSFEYNISAVISESKSRGTAGQEWIDKRVEKMPRAGFCEDLVGASDEKAHCAEGALWGYVYRKLKYPKEARKAKIEGIAVVQFVLEKSEIMTDITLVGDIGGGCGDAALDVVELMADEAPLWVPGTKNGEAVSVKYTLPIRFSAKGI